jgi:hypothetical protein
MKILSLKSISYQNFLHVCREKCVTEKDQFMPVVHDELLKFEARFIVKKGELILEFSDDSYYNIFIIKYS